MLIKSKKHEINAVTLSSTVMEAIRRVKNNSSSSNNAVVLLALYTIHDRKTLIAHLSCVSHPLAKNTNIDLTILLLLEKPRIIYAEGGDYP
ncbi:hypothetical protein ACFLYR_09775 [Chloroflexota bacterium]